MTPRIYRQGDAIEWIDPVMDKVIEGIEAGDKACVAIGIEFIEENQGFAFGKRLKSNTARALRRAATRSELTQEQMKRIRTRVLVMLLSGNVPYEYKEYAKLVRAIGLDRTTWHAVRAELGETNRRVIRYRRYFETLVNQPIAENG
jgi:hypothetical protein